MIKDILRLMRPKHYIKNGLILAPALFGGQLFNTNIIKPALISLALFSLVASVVYIINDTKDLKKDRLHPEKKLRPLASGSVSITQGFAATVVLAAVALALGFALPLSVASWGFVALYIVINIGYSFGLKNIPIVDVAVLASGFVIRVLFGASVFNIEVSHWLYLTLIAGSFYVSLGKRRNEIITTGTTSRKVNELYSLQFLDKNMYVCYALTVVFYSLWATDKLRSGTLMYVTIPLVVLIFMTYSLAIEKNNSTGDPVDVVLKNRSLQLLAVVYVLAMITAVYVK